MTNGATIQAPMTLEYDLSTVFPKKTITSSLFWPNSQYNKQL